MKTILQYILENDEQRKKYLFSCLDKTSDYEFDVSLKSCPDLEDYYCLADINIGREFKNHPEYICIFLIEIQEEEQYAGYGSSLMRDICEWADKNNKILTLTPSDDFGASSVKRLITFYKRFGFVENKGKHTDFTHKQYMHRIPKNN